MTENHHDTDHPSQIMDVENHMGRVKTIDQINLVWQSWIPEKPLGVIVIVHGLAEHGGRYQETAEYFASKGWAVYACDLRGHGMSPDGAHSGRVHVNRFDEYFKDVDAVIGLARESNKSLPLFLLGHSMGGLVSLLYVLQKPDGLAGAIISSPALGTHPDFKPPLFLKLLVSVLSRIAPRLLFKSDLDTSAISRDPLVVQAYIDDPLVSQKVSARWYAEMMKAMKTANEGAASLRLPTLLMQSGADRLVDPAAPGRWAEAAPSENVELVTWEGFFHEMLNEPEKDQVRARILSWLEKQTSHSGQKEGAPSRNPGAS